MTTQMCDVLIWGKPCGQPAEITHGLYYPCCDESLVRFRCSDCYGNVALTGTCRVCGQTVTTVESEPVRIRDVA